ncbi:hypothetical protein [Paractinoplanes maris]|uniref:hypothetical protein n=1 Tax=Paractinoplanes maris TaxID=1734446 RepID=UPI0020203655|nr:hypothetical protein [Actinoplanes maris]
MVTNQCPTADWSPVASAESNTQLAAVLAGFVFAGLVMLLSERRPGPTRVRTIGLFCAAFIVLGLASYLFGLVTGDTDPAACKRAWTETVVASGLLGLGAVAMVSGIAWLLAAYLVATPEGGDGGTSGLALDRLGQVVAVILYGVIAVVATLMAVTVYGYVRAWYATPSGWITGSLIAYTPVLLVVLITWRRLRPPRDGESERSIDAMFVGTLTAVGYAVVGSVFTGVVASTHISYWEKPSAGWLVVTALLALLVPAPTLVSLAYAVPSLTRGSQRDRPPASSEPAGPAAGVSTPTAPGTDD